VEASKLAKTTIITTSLTPAVIRPAEPDVVALLLADKRSPQTRRAYEGDLRVFFGGLPTPAQLQAFLALPPPALALRLAQWKAEMRAAGKAEATINRRLAAVRSLLRFAYRLGHGSTDGRGLVDGEQVVPYRDTRGIAVPLLKKLLAAAKGDTLKAKRDMALLRLLCENALRRAEVCALNVADFEPAVARLWITGKGRGTQREAVTLSAGGVAALQAHVDPDAVPSAPLFRNCRPGTRLTPGGLYVLVQQYGRKIGVPDLTPHKLRHSAITAALEAGMDVRQVQKLSRHRKLETLLCYDDARTDMQGVVTRKLAEVFDGDDGAGV
jgi:integrase/recombinase XerC